MKKPYKKRDPDPKEVAWQAWMERLHGITRALEVLVDVLPRQEFLEIFKKLHADNNSQYQESLKKNG